MVWIERAHSQLEGELGLPEAEYNENCTIIVRGIIVLLSWEVVGWVGNCWL